MPVNYAERVRETSPGSVLQGKSVVGLYFGRESCPHCGPFLRSLVALLRRHSDATIVFVSRDASEVDTMRYFYSMPRWTAVPHATAAGRLGKALVTRFGVSTIPALVLLDCNGQVICTDARIRLAADPSGLGFPWPAPAGSRRTHPTVKFAMDPSIGPSAAGDRAPSPPATPRHRKAGAGPVSALRPLLPPPPDGGQPPRFTEMAWHDNVVIDQDLARRAVARDRATRAPAGPADVENIRRPPAGIHARARTVRNAKRKTPSEIVDPGRPPKEPGKHTSLMHPQPLAEVHPFTPTMKAWRQGIPVDCGPDWTWAVIAAAVAHGPHPTARTQDSIALFAEDIDYQVKGGFCKVYLWTDLQKLRPANLKISPVAVVPQVGRRGRIILDLSFPVYQDVDGAITITQESVNDTTVLQAPSVPVKEIGRVLPRLLQYMRDTPAGIHILFCKLDISDGFWRLTVRPADSFNFAYVLPQKEGEPVRIVVPSAVQMGWVESPSLFCTVTESARDITQHLVDANVDLPPHPFEAQMNIQHVPLRARAEVPSKLLQVYVDDFCYASTEAKDGCHIPRIRRASIHGIHLVFPQPEVTGHVDGKEPISGKKLEKGDGNFTSEKEMVGFIFDGIKRTVRLPPTKAAAYIKEIHLILRRTSVPLKALQTLVGKLRHASIILPAARGFFTPINAAMRGSVERIGLGKRSDIRAALKDLCSLIHILGSRPTHVREILVDMPCYVGYHDAAAEGAGGVWFSLVHTMPPVVWRVGFPLDIAQDVVSLSNPHGSITNSDLELAAEILAVGVLIAKALIIKHQQIGTLCDNSPTVSWIEKFASKSRSPTAGRLLRGLAYMLYCHHAGRLTTVHVPGKDNTMADIASRPSKAHALFKSEQPVLSDHDFVSAFDTTFPLPEQQAWQLAMVPIKLKSNVFETLRGKQLELRQWTVLCANATGVRGRIIADSSPSTSGAQTSLQTTSRICSSRLLLPCGKASTASEVESRFSLSKSRSEPLPKSMFWTDIATPERRLQPNIPSTCPSHDY